MRARRSALAPALSSDLWHRLAAYEVGPDAAALTFAARLARENRWSDDHAARVIHEYKRFCYLAVTAGHEVTPSDAVDQAWHLHLTYSRDYWQSFCPNVLRIDLHHGPTNGGKAERARYYDQYAATLLAYEAAFDEPPPDDIWPAAQKRFHSDPKGLRVNPEDVMILDRRVAILGAAGWTGLGVVIAVLVGVMF
ncbi:glycine-rich domain-containing protein [Qipengyuania sp. ASV99]|uniref:glycine-rich domain-containing protein n=1 Tax=Qipengyuania sp. ASV99 TaxID=3399681 RepID=UPI003A4C6B7B